ncbi:MAG TPA: TlpA disulfide reductase family protein [Chitinophagaceae bacterium]|nr:TlpA disulfide reductase family protein [Chitinophagaceae bacterium]
MKKFFLGFLSGFLTTALGIFILGYIISKDFSPGEFQAPDLKLGISTGKGSYNLQLMSLKNQLILDSMVLRNKVLVLNFWERWCRPCKLELNSLEQLYNVTKDSSILFAVISKEDPLLTATDTTVIHSQLPFYHLKNIIPEVYNGEAVPRTFIIDKKGKVIIQETGARNWASESVVRFIDSLKKL